MQKNILLIIALFLFLADASAEEYKSKHNFRFYLPDGYQLFNNINLLKNYL